MCWRRNEDCAHILYIDIFQILHFLGIKLAKKG